MASAQQAAAVGQDEGGGASIAGGLVTSSVPSKRRVADVDLLLHMGAHGQQPQDGVVDQLSRAYLAAVSGGEDMQSASPVGFVIPAEGCQVIGGVQRDQVVREEGQIERAVRGAGDVEVDNPDHLITVEEQVAWVEVAVTDAIALRRHHRILPCPYPGLGCGEAVGGVVESAHGPPGTTQSQSTRQTFQTMPLSAGSVRVRPGGLSGPKPCQPSCPSGAR
jgi:hypothetical protein